MSDKFYPRFSYDEPERLDGWYPVFRIFPRKMIDGTTSKWFSHLLAKECWRPNSCTGADFYGWYYQPIQHL